MIVGDIEIETRSLTTLCPVCARPQLMDTLVRVDYPTATVEDLPLSVRCDCGTHWLRWRPERSS